MRFLAVLCALTSVFLWPARAMAEESQVRPGQIVLNVSATEHDTVQQDVLTASLRYEAEGEDSKALQGAINGVMAKALAKAKTHERVEAATDHYYVYIFDPHAREHPDPEERVRDSQKHRSKIWKGSQGIRLKSSDPESMLKLVSELQSMGLQTSDLGYALSPEAFEKTRDALLESALQKLTEKARRTAKALGKNSAELVEVNIDSDYPAPVPMMARAEALTSEMDTPVVSPGQSEITLTVSARAILR